MERALIIFLIASLTFYGIFWLFNHVNPWVSIATFVAAGYVAIKYFKQKNKQ